MSCLSDLRSTKIACSSLCLDGRKAFPLHSHTSIWMVNWDYFLLCLRTVRNIFAVTKRYLDSLLCRISFRFLLLFGDFFSLSLASIKLNTNESLELLWASANDIMRGFEYSVNKSIIKAVVVCASWNIQKNLFWRDRNFTILFHDSRDFMISTWWIIYLFDNCTIEPVLLCLVFELKHCETCEWETTCFSH